jgi:DNA polymerase epsilon subunit 4
MAGTVGVDEETLQLNEKGDTYNPTLVDMENDTIMTNEVQLTAEEIDTETVDSGNQGGVASQDQDLAVSQEPEEVDTEGATDVLMDDGADADIEQNENLNPSERTNGNSQATGSDKLLRLPLSRIKTIIKMDPEVSLASQEAVVTIARAAVRSASLIWLSKSRQQRTVDGGKK